VKVDEDPRVQFSDADRARRRKAVDSLVTMTKEADAARRKVVAINTALTSLTDGWKSANAPAVPEPIRKAADDLLARVKKTVAKFETPGGGRGGAAGPPPPYTPPPVPQKISRLMFALDGYSAAPTSRQMAELEDAAAQLKSGVAEVDGLWEEVPRLNQRMVEAGVPHFSVTLPVAGRGRGN
jgi:flavin-binding protein dodecin